MKRYLLTLLLLFCTFLAACGGSQASAPAASTVTFSGGSTPIPLNGPTTLHVTRSDSAPTDNLGPLDKTVTNARAVQNLYHAAQALPAYATGASISQSCLNDTGVIYHLDFLQGNTEVQRMNLDPGSCMILSLSSTDLRQVNAAFLTLFKQTIQVSSLTSN